MPMVSNPSDQATTVLPIQQPGERAVDQRRGGSGQQGTDRVMPPTGGPGPVTKPPVTPRPGAGPKKPGQHGASGPGQAAPSGDQTRPGSVRPAAKPRQAGSAPSPADVQPTVPAQPLSARPQAQGQRGAEPRPIAQPKRVTPTGPAKTPAKPDTPAARGGRIDRRLLLGGAAAVVVIAIIAIVVGLVATRPDNSPEARVRGAISSYADALAGGNLTELRSVTCGTLHDFYQNIGADQYAGVHKLAVDQRKIPKVDGVDSVQITGDKAVAQASVYTDADPTRVARTFDLQHTPDGWKVCNPPNAGR
ncbi:hypothetical protein IU452_11115 [Nocardia transvalensis]|nr:hypothetical protein [Nocardia transvalensis]